MGRRLGIGAGHLCDVEHERRSVSPERAARWARLLGYDEGQMVQLALQAMLDGASLRYSVSIERRPPGKKRAA